ncbi:MAG TPA: RsmB/NOP family class I SAM-dependent RNA methyltransferase [Ohtaekwangia sp.]|nr:RsmB/NOP family class I SAM-dependent RNA methyltransferase [Ohtaekwangia sp.]
MKLHRSTTEAVITALDLIFAGNRYADKVIEKILKQNPKWGARDRRFIAETTYDIVRWYRYLRAITGAKENDYWRLVAGWCVLHQAELPGWQEFDGIKRAEVLGREEEMRKIRKVRESIPDWLDQLGEQELGDRWEIELGALNHEAPVVLRVNTLKTTRDDLRETLFAEQIETEVPTDFPDALILKERRNIFSSPSFQEGLFEVQDAASQSIGRFLKAEPGMRIIDACAGAGGKTLHLAALVKNKGRIIAMDIEQWKLDELQKRARRAGVSNLETRLIDSSKVIKRLDASAERLLLDVPCSGLGVLKRNPDAKWKLSPDFIERVKELQQNILNDYASMVKPSGELVYSTCSILPSENEQQVKKFLEDQQGKFTLVDEQHAWPSEGFDGFYMARLRKTPE